MNEWIGKGEMAIIWLDSNCGSFPSNSVGRFTQFPESIGRMWWIYVYIFNGIVSTLNGKYNLEMFKDLVIIICSGFFVGYSHVILLHYQ